MIILSTDVETTGVDKVNDRITEIGLVLYSTGQKRVLESSGFLVRPEGVPITPEVTEITGITQIAVDTFGYSQEDAIKEFAAAAQTADAIFAHNGERFDRRVIENTAKRLGLTLPEKLWVDTMTDIPGVKGEQLVTMCAKAGFVYDAHGALADCAAVVKLTQYHDAKSSQSSYDKMLERAQSPTVVILSHQGRDKAENKAARKAGFRWNGDFKIWWKPVKDMDVSELASKVPFDISRAGKEYSLEVLQED